MAFTDLLVQLKDLIMRYGLAYVFRRYYSFYRAEVMDVEDPGNQGRIRVKCPVVSREETLDWAYPIMSYGGKNRGLFFPPDKGDFVWVGFEEGDVKFPYYMGGWWAKNDLGDDFSLTPPTVRGIQTSSGHVLLFDDTVGSEKIVIRQKDGSLVTLDTDKSITMQTAAGHVVKLNDGVPQIQIEDFLGNKVITDNAGITITDKNGNKIVLGAAGIETTAKRITTEVSPQKHTISAPLVDLGSSASSPAVHGDQLMLYLGMLVMWAAGHQHLQIGPTTPAAVAPTGPPPLPPSAIISNTVKLNST